MAGIDNFAPSKNKSVKGVSQEWFDVEIIKKLWLNNLKNNNILSNLIKYLAYMAIKKQWMRCKTCSFKGKDIFRKKTYWDLIKILLFLLWKLIKELWKALRSLGLKFKHYRPNFPPNFGIKDKFEDLFKFSQKYHKKFFSASTFEIRWKDFTTKKNYPLQSNFIETTLRHGCSPVDLQHIFRTPFPKNIFGRLLLNCI